jgi:nitrous oxidase accessory protein
MASFFRNSPGMELLDFLERLAPFSSPYRVLKDDVPRLSRKVAGSR